MTAVTASAPVVQPTTRLTATRAPLWRLMRSELSWVFRRPRTWISLILLAAVPIVVAVGVLISNGPRDSRGGSLYSDLAGNGLALPVIALFITLSLLLPLVGAMWAADALAGETSHGTLRGLLIAPVSRLRLLGIKAFGVATAIFAATVLIAIVGMVTGFVIVGSNGMVTLSGTTLSTWDALGRLGIAVGWVTIQVWAVAAIALAISACTEHPLVVMAATLAGAIVMGVLSAIPQLSWLQPYLLINSWTNLTDVLRDPMPTGSLLYGLGEAGCYLLVGLSLALARTVTKDG